MGPRRSSLALPSLSLPPLPAPSAVHRVPQLSPIQDTMTVVMEGAGDPEGPPRKPQAAVLKPGLASRTLSWVCTMEQTRIPGQLGVRTSYNGCRLPRLLGEGHPSHTHTLCPTSEPRSLRPRPGLTQLPLAVRASTEAPEILPASPPWKELAQPGWGLLSALGGGSSSGAPSGLSFRGAGQGGAAHALLPGAYGWAGKQTPQKGPRPSADSPGGWCKQPGGLAHRPLGLCEARMVEQTSEG